VATVSEAQSYERTCPVYNGTCQGSPSAPGATIHLTVGTAGVGYDRWGAINAAFMWEAGGGGRQAGGAPVPEPFLTLARCSLQPRVEERVLERRALLVRLCVWSSQRSELDGIAVATD
jgi:hypothetical protein